MILSAERANTLASYYWLSDPRFNEWLAEHLAAFGATICDIGAGTGNFIPALARYFKHIDLIEPSDDMLLQLRQRAAAIPGVRTICRATAEHLPLAAQSVDIVAAKSSMHHFIDIPAALREMRRVARNAIAIVEVIGPDPLSVEYARHLVLQKEPTRRQDRIFAEEDLINLLQPLSEYVRALHYDQYIDLQIWAENGDVPVERRKAIYAYADAQIGTVKRNMHIHRRNGRLIQLRRMALVIGILGK